MVESTPPKPIVPFYPGTYVEMETALLLGIPRETIRRWCVDDGIGRKKKDWGNVWKWDISLPALRMRIANDMDAFKAYCAGDTTSDLVAEYMNRPKELQNEQ